MAREKETSVKYNGSLALATLERAATIIIIVVDLIVIVIVIARVSWFI